MGRCRHLPKVRRANVLQLTILLLTILRCEKTVYLAEMMRAAGQTFHKSCFTCQVFSILPSMTKTKKSRFATNAWTARCFARGRARSSVGTATARTNIHLMYFYQFFPRQKLLFNYITILIMCFSPGKNYGPKGVGFGITANIEAS